MPAAFAESLEESPRGTLHLKIHSSGLLLATVRGHYGVDLLHPYLRALADVARSNRAIGFHDWEGMVSYDSECRRSMTRWTLQNISRVAKVHILVKHRLVAMGVATGSMLVGRNLVTAHTRRSEFEERFREASRDLG